MRLRTCHGTGADAGALFDDGQAAAGKAPSAARPLGDAPEERQERRRDLGRVVPSHAVALSDGQGPGSVPARPSAGHGSRGGFPGYAVGAAQSARVPLATLSRVPARPIGAAAVRYSNVID